ncbi:BLUF domain-containing protein [Marinomonas mediterranea]|jgi:Sensors of blue-light using FAD.|uniref:BLUF domain protein n=1 Tax=Marinomonas mediterranea (strain ATCC 700492 / JCM 21426 / NBRC 103028 / MMB-1) TaxID=717774 RepID=F2JZB3_MARM1|nr:BLUF domain-containing protein [Marinomonas mediterranea]ADZ93198.1 BLUF domain protein [Marinomonas mediterranea MMB-1]WCN11094.1 blue light sensor protein [Marinomonas mediterranea]WCN15153.1 blue light sensor protein [Marinomonas mediterranea]WCN19197.1 blue light sensor protein [Marinomonas mediterranea MMB-1]
MYLTRLIYASTISDNISPSAIADILDSANKHNKLNDITGVLFFDQKYFLQCLEGSRFQVNETYNRLLQDNRHSDLVLLEFKDISVRAFPDWTMGFIPESVLSKAIHLKFSPRKNFNPYNLRSDSAYQMLLELKELLPE